MLEFATVLMTPSSKRIGALLAAATTLALMPGCAEPPDSEQHELPNGFTVWVTQISVELWALDADENWLPPFSSSGSVYTRHPDERRLVTAAHEDLGWMEDRDVIVIVDEVLHHGDETTSRSTRYAAPPGFFVHFEAFGRPGLADPLGTAIATFGTLRLDQGVSLPPSVTSIQSISLPVEGLLVGEDSRELVTVRAEGEVTFTHWGESRLEIAPAALDHYREYPENLEEMKELMTRRAILQQPR